MTQRRIAGMGAVAWGVLATVVGLSACVVQQGGDVPKQLGPKQLGPKQLGPECAAAGLQSLVGLPEARLATMALQPPVRLLRPGMAMTMDYSPSRLNVEIDAKGIIARIFCG